MNTERTGTFEPTAGPVDFDDEGDRAQLGVASLEVTDGNETTTCKASVQLELRPSAGLYVYAPLAGNFHVESIRLRDRSGQAIGGGQVAIVPTNHGIRLKWMLAGEPVEVVGDDRTEMVRLMAPVVDMWTEAHVRRTGPRKVINLNHGPWRVTIMPVDTATGRRQDPQAKSGCRQTHTVEVTHENARFTGEEASDMLRALRSFLSFASGGTSTVVCPWGTDPAGAKVWVRWCTPSVVAGSGFSWLAPEQGETLAELWPGFMDRWSKDGWKSALEVAIRWYAWANTASPSVGAGIVNAQIAMERLWKESGAKRYDRLLKELCIPTEIPDAAMTLSREAEERKWSDGPDALFAMRNSLVHEWRDDREPSDKCYVEAWLVTMRFVELAVLALCGFKGKYWNRVAMVTEPVPWIHPAGTTCETREQTTAAGEPQG